MRLDTGWAVYSEPRGTAGTSGRLVAYGSRRWCLVWGWVHHMLHRDRCAVLDYAGAMYCKRSTQTLFPEMQAAGQMSHLTID